MNCPVSARATSISRGAFQRDAKQALTWAVALRCRQAALDRGRATVTRPLPDKLLGMLQTWWQSSLNGQCLRPVNLCKLRNRFPCSGWEWEARYGMFARKDQRRSCHWWGFGAISSLGFLQIKMRFIDMQPGVGGKKLVWKKWWASFWRLMDLRKEKILKMFFLHETLHFQASVKHTVVFVVFGEWSAVCGQHSHRASS